MKKIAIMLIAAVVLHGAVFAQEEAAEEPVAKKETIHKQGDMLLSIDFGLHGAYSGTPFELKKGSLLFAAEAGAGFDYYALDFLSVSSGLFVHESLSLYLKNDILESSNIDLGDILKTPFCLSIPIRAHVNIPGAEFLYVGLGLQFNIPLFSILEASVDEKELSDAGLDTKGSMFLNMPIDLGFDFIKKGASKGARLTFRIVPTFFKNYTTVGFGFNVATAYKLN
ncbi:MAG: hypothetical protein LBC53_00510 [Spirochaetaceae bacterium]|jgi:hypothetical protein|nr:hypothetical protein [Spirochaetaceae bacterium]